MTSQDLSHRVCLPIYFISLLLTSSSWGNTTVQSRIHDIDYGTHPHDETLILLENGRVLRIKNNDKSSLLTKDSQFLKISFDKNNYILDVSEKDFVTEEESFSPVLASFEPTSVNGLEAAEEYFNDNRNARNESECFNRAHVWSYELWKKHQVKSQKIFLFFSRRYIREKKFKWWFHVAPMIQVNDGTLTVERVLDSSFSNSSQDIHSWKNTFIGDKIECPTVSKYSDYADYPFINDCSILKAPMFIHQPLDLEMQEVWGIEKTEFSPADLKTAYKEAFKINYTGEK